MDESRPTASHLHARTGSWHWANWGPLGLLETVLKGAAFLVAYAAVLRAANSSLALPNGKTAIEVMLLGLAEAGLLAAIWDRVTEREVTALIFVVANNAAHLALIWALCTVAGAGVAVWVFALLMLAGELVKIVFLRTTGFTVRAYSTRLVLALTGVYAATYAAVLALAVLA
jgi:hypothetical protein